MKRTFSRRIAALVLVLSMTAVADARAAVVSGSVVDRNGDGYSPNGVHPYDLAYFGLRYDSSDGQLTASYRLYDLGVPPSFSWTVEAQIGAWDPTLRACDVQSPGAVSLTLRQRFDAPLPYDLIDYSVVGYNHGAIQQVQVYDGEGRHSVGDQEFWDFADSEAFDGRAYNCVANVALRNGAGGVDYVRKTFCMGTSGTIACHKLRKVAS